ncbi:alkaline phosphatase family protein [Niveispirillum sp. KHB5.9]|uniref:alkaline phosphatase family protein n=1 Tax=Niveispirillum sp. KHB5.9 TaxID=3400269 RepID=UPI003A8B52DA
MSKPIANRKRSRHAVVPPTILLGPLARARGAQGATGSGQRWRVSVCFLLAGDAEPPDLRVDGVTLAVPPRFLHEWKDLPPVGPVGVPCPPGVLRMWRYDFAVPRGLQDGRAVYGFQDDERRWTLSVPGTAIPPRIAFVSCGGCEDEAQIEAAGLKRNALWARLLGRHRAQPLHLMLMGGDQVYADELWQRVPALRQLSEAKMMKRTGLTAGPELEAQLEAWYIATYLHAWNQAEPAALQAGVASMCMWDDHDIIDGWGSHPPELLDSPAYQAIYAAARRAFRLFQVGMGDDDPADTLVASAPPGFSQGMMLNGIGILAPDLRSERTHTSVLSPASLSEMPEWLERFATCRHLLLMSSVPLIFPGFGLAERLLNMLPGRQTMEDDLRDQWRSPVHLEQWRTVLRILADFARRSGVRITILSGEVHLAAHGTVSGPGTLLRQLVSSGIVHPPPHGVGVQMMELRAAKREELWDRLSLSMEVMDENGRRLLAQRNYLTINGQDEGDLLAEWHIEGRDEPWTITIR